MTDRPDEDALSKELVPIVEEGPDRLKFDEDGNVLVDRTLDTPSPQPPPDAT